MFVAILVSLAAWPWIADRLDQAREDGRDLAIAARFGQCRLDGAGHRRGRAPGVLHGYARGYRSLVELALCGIRFDSAQASSSWTLPSHATMFTGRWLHELSVGWPTRLTVPAPH